MTRLKQLRELDVGVVQIASGGKVQRDPESGVYKPTETYVDYSDRTAHIDEQLQQRMSSLWALGQKLPEGIRSAVQQAVEGKLLERAQALVQSRAGRGKPAVDTFLQLYDQLGTLAFWDVKVHKKELEIQVAKLRPNGSL